MALTQHPPLHLHPRSPASLLRCPYCIPAGSLQGFKPFSAPQPVNACSRSVRESQVTNPQLALAGDKTKLDGMHPRKVSHSCVRASRVTASRHSACTPLQLSDGQHSMDSTACTAQGGQHRVDSTAWTAQHGQHSMDSTAWTTQHCTEPTQHGTQGCNRLLCWMQGLK